MSLGAEDVKRKGEGENVTGGSPPTSPVNAHPE